MVASQDSWPPPGWLTRKQAAERLNLSPSRIAALNGGANPKPGEIHTSGQKSPYSGQNCTLYHAGDVERLAFERENPAELSRVTVPLIPSAAPARHIEYPPIDIPALVAEMKSNQLKPWLTIEESAAYLGLPASIIQKLVESGKLPALDCGPRPGGRWRVKRSDLDALEGDR